ncbi:uncharacterized protein LOC102196298 isoform X2 [Pundamilia nyererei]|uniref:Uncharacterized protein LOC102196298 isoform X2 n=1 Tax=Pundamilia nyererei TaxID=303518 RepID=A0A9Y3VP22_9CICH|nr:PREDICTED: uncharacterized protein LOC102196298 isoform X2 [Pundamilia nyererei]
MAMLKKTKIPDGVQHITRPLATSGGHTVASQTRIVFQQIKVHSDGCWTDTKQMLTVGFKGFSRQFKGGLYETHTSTNQPTLNTFHYQMKYKTRQEEFQHQSESFKNRTAIFRDQLASGNFSLVINPLMLKDDQLSIEVAYIPESRTLCQTTVHVAARFEMPNIVVNTIDMMAMCATKGGFPEPELSWISVDHEGHERTLEPPDVQTLEIYKEDDGTYRVTSTANIRGSQKVTCSVYNPTSKETLSVIKDVITDEGWSLPLGAVLGVPVILAVILGAGAAIGCRKMKRRDCSGQSLQQLSANEPAPLEDSTPDPAAVVVDDVAK